MMTRFAFLSFVSLFVFSCSVPCAADKPNVLFIAADDMNCDLGAYGHPLVKTPNLDRLCEMGVRFDAAYCQQPLCGPSRASIMTGLRPDTLDMHTLAHELRQKNPDVITLGQLFRNNGYYSARAGKIYHYGNPSMIGTDGNDDPATWDQRHNPIGIDRSQQEKITRYGAGRENDKNLGISMAWWDPKSRDDEHTDGLVASKIVELIRQKKDEPFFLAAGFFNPHCPYVAPKKYFDLYPLDQIKMPDLDAARRDLEDVPAMAVQRDAKNWPYYFKDVTVEEARKCKQAYFATISFVDAQVGRLLDALEEHDLMDNTIIVFWSDHGYFLGEKGLWYKRKAFERSARMPLIIAAPGLSQGAETTKPVELLDLYPTLADLCGLKPPANLEGKSLRPLLSDPSGDDWNKPAVTQVWHNKNAWGYSIRTERYRYTEWLEGRAGRELYDHSVDVEEITNLADAPAHAKTVAELSSQLAKFVRLQPDKRENSRDVSAAGDLFDMNAIRNPKTLEVEVIQDWHVVEGRIATRQKLVNINVGEIWPSRQYRLPVRMVVPAGRKAKGFHLTGGSTPTRLQQDTKPNPLEQDLLSGGVGLVFTVVQEPGSYGERDLAQAAERRFAETLNPRCKIQYWAWPATLMRAITTAYAETDHFEKGKVAATGGSKNGASPSMAILHDDRMTAVHATVSPIWDSPLRLCDRAAWDELESQPDERGGFSGGHFGPNFNKAVLAAGHTWKDLQKFTRDISDDVFISRNLKQLRQRGVEMLFHPGTHDMVAYDLAWGGSHHRDIPIYLGANTGHGKRGHPQLERNEQNKAAFLLQHFFPDEMSGPLLETPTIEHQLVDGNALEIAIRFPVGSEAESGRIWWMFDRAPDGSPGYLSEPIPDDNCAEMVFDRERGVWVAELELSQGAGRVDFFSNHRKTVRHQGKTYATYLSSPYTRVALEE